MHVDRGPVPGAIMPCVAQSQVHTELLRTKLIEFLLLCLFSFAGVGARGETRRRHVNPLWSGNKAADKGRWGWQRLLLHLSPSKEKMIYRVISTYTNNIAHVLPCCLHQHSVNCISTFCRGGNQLKYSQRCGRRNELLYFTANDLKRGGGGEGVRLLWWRGQDDISRLLFL